ncbi:MAG: DUF4124 domain-containing protein [Nitrospirae bacterium]|nr:MAG: DUF4124 domain-containing protein [Nitrospirota bacterium]
MVQEPAGSLTFVRLGDYAFCIMMVRREIYGRGLLVVLAWMALAGLPASTDAAKFYSWIDASGTMVMTDDAGLVPPPMRRSGVSVHRFLDRPLEPARSPKSMEPGKVSEPSLREGRDPIASSAPSTPVSVEPASLDLPREAFEADFEQNRGQVFMGQVLVGGRPWQYGVDRKRDRAVWPHIRIRWSGSQDNHHVDPEVHGLTIRKNYIFYDHSMGKPMRYAGSGHASGRR